MQEKKQFEQVKRLKIIHLKNMEKIYIIIVTQTAFTQDFQLKN